jgi:hypothetical protein
MATGWVLTESEAKQSNMRKLTKKEIQEGLELIPMDRLLLGNSSEVRFTAKQKKFAEELAKGNTKTGAYRKAYNTKARPAIQATSASRLASQPHIQLLAERISTALEAQKYQTPAHIRALTIHELTKHAISDETAPAQRIKALELLGKITEVALFTERREVVQVTDSADARAKLMHAMRLAISSHDTIDAEYTSADDLLAELAGNSPDDDMLAGHEEQATDTDADTNTMPANAGAKPNDIPPTPPHPDPEIKGNALPPLLHSIPHNQSAPKVSENTGLDEIIDDFDEN